MPGVVITTLLISSLLLVHFSVRMRPLPADRPLNEDAGLPLPEIGQASTVFSLTALFGAYLGIYLLLGLPALAGLAVGTGAGLVLIRRWVQKKRWASFEEFLASVLGRRSRDAHLLAFAIAAIQLSYAASELLILREISTIYLGVRPEHATLLVSGLGVIAYFYVLFGGYMAVFRTDVLQFGFVAVMAGAIVIMAPEHLTSDGWTNSLLPRNGYWTLPLVRSGFLLFAYHFGVAAVMGLGFIIASPDAWKRVFLVADRRRGLKRRFTVFMFAGIAPFLVLVPLGAISGRVPDGVVDPAMLWNGVLSSNTLFVATALGLIASFLSAFDSAILGAVHVSLIARRQTGSTTSETRDFHWLMSAFLVTVCLLFGALLTQNNPYLLGNVLIGPYAVVAGILVGGRGRPRLREGMLLPTLIVGQAIWFVYMASQPGILTAPTTHQVNTVPAGALLFVISTVAAMLMNRRGPRRV